MNPAYRPMLATLVNALSLPKTLSKLTRGLWRNQKIALGLLVARLLCDRFKPRQQLEAEILVLRHQLNILQQRTNRRQFGAIRTVAPISTALRSYRGLLGLACRYPADVRGDRRVPSPRGVSRSLLMLLFGRFCGETLDL